MNKLKGNIMDTQEKTDEQLLDELTLGAPWLDESI